MIEKSYAAALKFIADGEAKEAGIAVGTRAAEAVLAKRMNDGSKEVDTYRPHTSAGNYVPTTIPAVPHWTNRKPWLMKTSSQFRPGAPPALNSKQWARDFMEVKNIGRLDSAQRSQQQTEIAKFWEATLPPIYHGVVHSVAAQTGRSVTENARLFALITQGADDALIAVFDAKYHHGFWRPITAIRNADIDGNDDTERDATWQPFIPTPMHPEYPCAHCVVAGTVGAILKAEMGSLPMPVLSTSSVTANGVTRSWPSVDEFVQEVSDARIYDGVHYRTSAEVGTAMGISIGENTVDKF
ncbi:MAG: vanadium-dependent haloperoxidase [Arenicella sp.]|nr:vanadium-dependent haloperoxidase [Arenicella sp.]